MHFVQQAKEYVHKKGSSPLDAFQLLLWCEFRCAVANTCSVVPGGEPHPLLGVSRDCRLVMKPVLRDVIDAIFSRRPAAKLVYTSPRPPGGIIGLDFIDCCVSRPFN